MEEEKSLVLNNGLRIPIIGLGTAKIGENDVVVEAVVAALETGYRHIDTAYMHENEEAVGEGIRKWLDSNPERSREEIFVTTKLPMIGMRQDLVEKFLKLSLDRLKLDYVDLYLIHCPMGLRYKDENTLVPLTDDGMADIDTETDLESVWRAMEHEVDEGRAKAIGLSNCNNRQIKRISETSRIKPANLQMELHVYMQHKGHVSPRNECDSITITSYAPLGSPEIASLDHNNSLLEDSTVGEIAKECGKTPTQILLRHLIQSNIIVIPKSRSSDRIKEIFQIFDFKLTNNQMMELNKLDKGSRGRVFDFKKDFKGCEEHPEYPF